MDESVQGDAIDEQQKSQPSSSPGAPPSPEANAKTGLYLTYFGKHRMAAAISNLHNQINIIQVIPPQTSFIILIYSNIGYINTNYVEIKSVWDAGRDGATRHVR